MNRTLKIILFFTMLIGISVMFSCKNFKKFKEARAENKAEKEQQAELEEQAEEVTEKEEEVVIATDSLYFSYQKTPCFGRCPTFELKVYQSGFATYNGTNFVDFIGFYKYNFDQETMDSIKAALHESDFFNMKDSYDNEHVSDLPAKIIGANIDGLSKKVTGRYGLPDEFKELYKALDKIFENVEWTPHSGN